MSYSPNLVVKLNAIAHDYKSIIEKEIIQVLSQPEYKNTGASADSVKVQVINGNEKEAPQITIDFANQLNIVNLKGLQWTNQPPVDDLEQWGNTKQFDGPVPGYKNGLAPNLPPWKAKQRIIWAIAKSKQKFDTWKPKPWRKKSLGTVLKELNKLVLKGFEEAIQLDFENATKA